VLPTATGAAAAEVFGRPSISDGGVLATTCVLLRPILTLLVAPAIDAVSAPRLASIGLLVLGLGCAALGTAHSVGAYMTARVALLLAMALVDLPVLVTLVARHVRSGDYSSDPLPLLVGLLLATADGVTIGFPRVFEVSFDEFGWRTVAMACGFVCALCACCAPLFCALPPYLDHDLNLDHAALSVTIKPLPPNGGSSIAPSMAPSSHGKLLGHGGARGVRGVLTPDLRSPLRSPKMATFTFTLTNKS
jgi:MFS family permease